MGSEVYLYLKYAGITLTARVDPKTKSRTGDNVKVALDMQNIHLFDVETENTIIN
jgi:multiple sugar transport system ATP-binding protein